MKTVISIVLCVIISVSFSCQKADAPIEPIDFACDKMVKIARQSFGNLEMVISYENGKIARVTRADGKGLTENYSYQSDTVLVITRNFSDGSVGNIFKTSLNKKGYIVKLVQDGSAGYTNTFTYDTDGFLKTASYAYVNDPKLNSSSAYTYANGNLMQIKNVTGNVLNYTVDYTYYEDKLNKADLIGNQNQPDMYGRISKNLIKTIKYTYADKKTELTEYTYEQNTNGFVKSLVEKFTDKDLKTTTQTNKYEYICL
ncbi:DUF4595 domain-containing protein [Emticicia sp. BO119]|uniref:DUF4595 domain-containing protein n=1 Tax=Emticicia sp. BO119 TaxID=2757768 RepID=UPI0015F0A13B|nr:DUF4595 domain-containing protein [Emticicia sp. BO119]MBA4851218.1 DUF4595 domain-containing protein [Emticicia sp. BO119]